VGGLDGAHLSTFFSSRRFWLYEVILPWMFPSAKGMLDPKAPDNQG